MLKVLALFSGTKSVTRALPSDKYEVISVDIVPKFAPTFTANILDWDYKQFPPDHFDVVWASPPCAQFSRARTNSKKPRDIATAESLVRKSLEIIKYFESGNSNLKWFIENPRTGLLCTGFPKDGYPQSEVLKHLPHYDVDYCQYSADGDEFKYLKKTRIWTNREGFTPKTCPGRGKCEHMEGRRHMGNVTNSPLSQRYRVPKQLIKDLIF